MKVHLRKHLLDKRSSLASSYRMNADTSLHDALTTCPQVESASKIAAFYPHKGEPNILPFLEWVLESGRELFLPRVKDEDVELVQIDDLSKVEPQAFDIHEPHPSILPTEHIEFDVILVPGLGFTSEGDRIGYGKGFYDRLLKKVRAYTIGVGYDFQVVEEIPTEEHDHQLDMILTDQGVYIC